MLSTILLAATTLLPLQMQPTTASATDEAAAPAAQTDEKVRNFLKHVEDRLYDAEDYGLTQLSFTLPINLDPTSPTPAATANVAWSKGTRETVDTVVGDFELPPQAAMMGATKEQIAATLPAKGQLEAADICDKILNRFISSALESYVATIDGVDDEGLIKVKLVVKPGQMGMNPMKEQVFFIDDDSVVRKSTATLDTPMGPATLETLMTWKEAEGTDKLLWDTQTIYMNTPMGKIKAATESFSYRKVGEVWVLDGKTTTIPANPMMGVAEEQSLETRLQNLVVNQRDATSVYDKELY